MKNVALEFLSRLSEEPSQEEPSPECLKLLDWYFHPKFSLPKDVISSALNVTTVVYKNKVREFISLYEYFSLVNLTLYDIVGIRHFLSTCSKVEAHVFFMILTRKLAVLPQLKEFKELKQVVVQEVPKRAKRVLIEVNDVGVKVIIGEIKSDLLKNIENSFKGALGTLEGFVTNNCLYIHDIWSEDEDTQKRMLFITTRTNTRYIKWLTPMYLEHTKYIDYFYKTSKLLIKPIKGTHRNIFKYGF